MPTAELPDDLLALIRQHTPSMDHVALLVAMRDDADRAHQAADLARVTRLDRVLVDQVLRDLGDSALVAQQAGGFRYSPTAGMAGTVDELAEMYHTRPVTLVRAIYDRPKRAVQSFADAFRLRKEGE